MPDWLTHVLVAYALGTLLSLAVASVRPRHVTLAMAGALLPDLSKLKLAVPSDAVASALGVPFDWNAFHTLGGTVAAACFVAVVLPADHRRRGILLLAIGATSHHALDLLLSQSSGLTYPFLWPLSEYRAPAVGLYRSSDREPALAASVVAIATWYARHRFGSAASRRLGHDRAS